MAKATAGIVLGILVGMALAPAVTDSAPRARYDYHTVNFTFIRYTSGDNLDDLTGRIGTLGEQGWELAGVTPTLLARDGAGMVLFFKRTR